MRVNQTQAEVAEGNNKSWLIHKHNLLLPHYTVIQLDIHIESSEWCSFECIQVVHLYKSWNCGKSIIFGLLGYMVLHYTHCS